MQLRRRLDLQIRNEMLALRLRTQQQGGDEARQPDAAEDQHRLGKAYSLFDREVGDDGGDQAGEDGALVIAERGGRGADLGGEPFGQVAWVLPLYGAGKRPLQREGD